MVSAPPFDPAGEAGLRLAKTVTECSELDDPRWRSLALVFSLSNSGSNFSNSGYAYGAGKSWWAVALPCPTVRPPLLAWLETQASPIPQGLIKVLMHFDRGTGETRLKAEMATPDRWAINPDNARTMVDVLRPEFS